VWLPTSLLGVGSALGGVGEGTRGGEAPFLPPCRASGVTRGHKSSHGQPNMRRQVAFSIRYYATRHSEIEGLRTSLGAGGGGMEAEGSGEWGDECWRRAGGTYLPSPPDRIDAPPPIGPTRASWRQGEGRGMRRGERRRLTVLSLEDARSALGRHRVMFGGKKGD
jgi:hypothetical protein